MQQKTGKESSQQKSFLSGTFSRLNKFRTGFIFGAIFVTLLVAGASHLVFNVFKFGQVSFGPNSVVDRFASPTTTTESNETVVDDSDIDQDVTSTENSEDTINADDSNVNQREVSDDVGNNISAGGDVNLTITYTDNSELPGFNADKGYSSEPPDISQFDDALLISDVSFGPRNFESLTQDVFILGKKYRSTFYLKPNSTEVTRVAFSVEGSPQAKGVFFQFGLGDWTSGTTTLTYLVKISADGQPLWSGQVKYAESQVASVVLDIQDYTDVSFEYQIVETGGANPYQNPLYFTEAKLLFD